MVYWFDDSLLLEINEVITVIHGPCLIGKYCVGTLTRHSWIHYMVCWIRRIRLCYYNSG